MANQNISGGRELDAALQSLSVKIEKNILRSASRAGVNEFKDEVRSNLVSTGSIESNMLWRSVRVSSKAKGGRVTASIKIGNKKAWYGHLIEFGVKAHGTKKGADRERGKYQDGKLHPGFSEKPFARPAFDSKSGAALAAFAAQVRKRLTAENINVPAPEVE
jgi:HK97 gp10 family phage protein